MATLLHVAQTKTIMLISLPKFVMGGKKPGLKATVGHSGKCAYIAYHYLDERIGTTCVANSLRNSKRNGLKFWEKYACLVFGVRWNH